MAREHHLIGATERVARAEVERTLEGHLKASDAEEVPGGDLCVEIARCHKRLGSPQESFRWLARVPDDADSFRTWSAAASLLAQVRLEAEPESRRTCRLGLAGSYTTSQFAVMLPLAALRLGIDLVVHEGLYDQYRQDLIDPNSSLYAADPDVVLLAVHEGALGMSSPSDDPDREVAAELERWTGLWGSVSRHSKATVVQHNFAVRPEVPLGHLSASLPESRPSMIESVNRGLAAAAGDDVSLVDCERVAAGYGKDRWFDDRYWYRSKQAVALEALPLLTRHTAAVIGARLGLSRKCLVFDLDNTLWGGVIGEDGLEGIVLGGDGAGEAFVALQDYALQLKERGVILAVASKNNEADAREVFEKHPEMRIGLDDISVFSANWDDKPGNLRRIAKSLDIGLDSLVFVDDNAAERLIVRQLLPEVDVIPLPDEPAGYRRALARYLGFEVARVTSEDRQRTDQYRARAAATELASSADDIESFYRDLRMQAVIAPFDELHLPRISQLVGKTNQFNLTTRRHTSEQLRSFMESSGHVTAYLKLADRFTEHGLVALAIGDLAGPVLEIDTLLMSCRVIGRTVEAALLAYLCRAAQAAGCSTIRGTYIPSPKNEIVRDVYERFGFTPFPGQASETGWEYDLATGPIESPFIALVEEERAVE